MRVRLPARWPSRVALAATVALTGACSWVLGLPDQTSLATENRALDVEAQAPSDDGPRLEEDAATDTAVPCSSDLDRDGENCGRCGRTCRGANCVGGRCDVTQLAGSPMPTALALTQTHVYFIDRETSTVHRVPKAGGAVETLASGGKLQALLPAIAVDDARMVWATDTGTFSRAFSCPRDGCGGSPPTEFLATEPDISSFTYENGHLYASVITVAPTVGRVVDQPLSGGPSSIIRDAGASALIDVDRGLLARVQGSSVYVGAPTAGAAERYVGAVFGKASGIMTDGTNIAWCEQFIEDAGGSIWAATDAQAARLVARGHLPAAVLIDGDILYWANQGDSNTPGGVLACPLAGCPVSGPVAITIALARPVALAADDDWIYVATLGLAPSGPGAVVRVSKL